MARPTAQQRRAPGQPPVARHTLARHCSLCQCRDHWRSMGQWLAVAARKAAEAPCSHRHWLAEHATTAMSTVHPTLPSQAAVHSQSDIHSVTCAPPPPPQCTAPPAPSLTHPPHPGGHIRTSDTPPPPAHTPVQSQAHTHQATAQRICKPGPEMASRGSSEEASDAVQLAAQCGVLPGHLLRLLLGASADGLLQQLVICQQGAAGPAGGCGQQGQAGVDWL